MPETIDPAVLVEIKGCSIEFTYDSSILQGITLHRPMGSKNTHSVVCEEIEARLPVNARLVPQPPEFNGTIHIRTWKVEYGEMPKL